MEEDTEVAVVVEGVLGVVVVREASEVVEDKLMEEESLRTLKKRRNPTTILTDLKREQIDLTMKENQPHATTVDPSSTT